MRAYAGVVTLVSALFVSASATAATARLTDEDVERLLERIEKEVAACGLTPPDELEEAARAMREGFGEKSPANEEVRRFLVLAQAAPCAALGESVSRLAETYHVDRDMEPPLWRARRMNDAELEGVLTSLGAVAVPFTRELEQVVKYLDPCTVVEGEREDIVVRARGLSRAAEALRRAVAKDGDASAELDVLLSTAKDVRAFLERFSISRVLRDTWGPVERDLSLVATAFGVSPS